MSYRGGTGYQTIYVWNFCHAQHEILFYMPSMNVTYFTVACQLVLHARHEEKALSLDMSNMSINMNRSIFFPFGHNLGIRKAQRELRMSQ